LQIGRTLRLHPRIAYQGYFATPASRLELGARLPELMAFTGVYHGVLAVVDWDHRLPSRRLVLRVHCFYDAPALTVGQAALDERLRDIKTKDLFPEFDVPDFAELPADEVYEIELDDQHRPTSSRLNSAWRRDIASEHEADAIAIARASPDFVRIAALSRPAHLGDLEAVSWTPPCESGHARWTLDVWYLLAFDGRTGSGRSLLVDLSDRRVVAVRDFSVRTS
jgi:hypothetical protein